MNEPANEFGHILIIDDDPEVCGTLLSLLSRMQLAGESARSLNAGLAKLEKGRFDLVFLDVRLPDGNGLDALARIKLMPGSPEVIILTGQGDPDGAELAIQGGVWDYLVKPSPVKQTLLSIQRVLKYRKEKQGTTPVVALDLSHLVGRGSEMRGIQDFIAQAARSQAGVLINGETGTGKELTARTIHENGTRAANRFIVVDCAALTETLVESTLFGHRRGAFTGADRDRTGLIKLADGGTLFLDEVGEMPLNIQRVFLRVLQEKRFRPVGENREESSDFRIIAATNKNLEDEVRAGRFRDDLLFRLKTMNVTLPPLRCRKEDIRDLVMFHVRKLAKRYDTPEKGVGSDFLEVLETYHWPGNVRELFNVLERAFVAAGEEGTLYAMHLPKELRISAAKASIIGKRPPCAPSPNRASDGNRTNAPSPPPFQGDIDMILAEATPSLKAFKSMMEQRYLRKLIAMTRGDLAAILSISGLSRSHFYALLKKNRIAFKQDDGQV
ncbi:putative two component, sigma54 specific, transcriptional regulator, Fis family [Desulfosarcina cetonica]|nr:putative two component, sigma54 specific, transcriptional regulator, Fis family [Desulfosarcina cetonica]